MIELYTDILSKAEKAAGEGNDLNSVLEILRELPLEDFGLFFVNLPDRNYPHLSKLLPPMAAVDTQKNGPEPPVLNCTDKQHFSFVSLKAMLRGTDSGDCRIALFLISASVTVEFFG